MDSDRMSTGGEAPPSPMVSISTNGRKTVDKAADFANYFCTYAFLYHQKEMLTDNVRMESYFNAIMRNPCHFKDKVVLDVGTGSGILAIWAAQAGAKKVYAVEATDMSVHARTLIKHNGLENVVHVIQASVEEAVLPEKVDVIVSEWMGYFLVRESMLDSVIIARDRWLKPGGVMYPSHARMWLAPITSHLTQQKSHEYQQSMEDWTRFVSSTKSRFNVDMAALGGPFAEEQKKYFLQTAMWSNIYPDQILSEPYLIHEIDCSTVSISDIEVIRCPFEFAVRGTMAGCQVDGYGGWFDVQFRGGAESPAEFPVELSTAPNYESSTHWGQQVFLLHPPLLTSTGNEGGRGTLEGSVLITRSERNHRLMDLTMEQKLIDESGHLCHSTSSKFFIE